jgi:hypothetical protein
MYEISWNLFIQPKSTYSQKKFNFSTGISEFFKLNFVAFSTVSEIFFAVHLQFSQQASIKYATEIAKKNFRGHPTIY